MLYFKPDVYYTKNNEWAEKLNNKNIRVGIDDYSQSALGDIVYIELPKTGTDVKSGEVIASLEATKAVNEITAPVSGIITDVNKNLENSPSVINHDPFGDGWIIEIKPYDFNQLESEISELMKADDYKNYLKNNL